eukprot:8233672-Lingulodinium_polyedra.AAC.1
MGKLRGGAPRGFTIAGMDARVEVRQEVHGVCGEVISGERPSQREMALLDFAAEEGFRLATTS